MSTETKNNFFRFKLRIYRKKLTGMESEEKTCDVIYLILFREAKENSYCSLKRSSERRVSNPHTVTKRATIWDSFFNFFNFNIGSSDENQDEAGSAQNHRVPRKIRDNNDFRESKCK